MLQPPAGRDGSTPGIPTQRGERILKDNACDLILLDVNMPDGNGFDFARELTSEYSIPFLFITAHNLEDEIIEGLRIGADDYITKPFSLRVVIEKVKTVLNRYPGSRARDCIHCGSLDISLNNRTVRKTENFCHLRRLSSNSLRSFWKTLPGF